MRIKTQFTIAMALFAGILVVVTVSAIMTNQKVEQASRQERIAAGIARGAGELGHLSNDYLIYRESQQLARWQSGFAAFSGQVAVLKADTPEQQALVASIRAGKDRMKAVFDSAAATSLRPPENGGEALNPAFLQVSWSRMAIQSQALAADALRLSKLLNQERDRLTNARTLLLYAMIGLFGLFLLASYFFTSQRILKSIAGLRTGAAVIGSGNLDFAIEEKTNDEIGELSHAFNRMATDLKAVTASRADLEREIAERKRAEEELRRQRKWFQVTLASIGDGVIATDAAGRITFINPVAQSLTGWQREEALGEPVQNVFRIINEKSREAGGDIVARVIREGTIVTLANNMVLITREGREIPIEDSAAPIRDAEGHIAGVVLVFHDVTEKRRARHALQESEERYRTLFETMTEGFALHEIICDDAGRPCDYRFLEINPAFERQTGTKAADLVGHTLYEVLPQSESLWVDRYGAVALTGEPIRFDQWSEALGRHYEVSAFRTGPGRFGVVFLDITERKLTEKSLAEHAAKLEAANKELESFSYSVSHDLRAPLRAINGYAQMILRKGSDRFDEEVRRRFEMITNNAEKMGQLIDDLLAFSRLGSQDVVKLSLDMEELIGEVWQELRNINPCREMTLKICKMPAVCGDSALIRQVYSNLLGNAVKFTQGENMAMIEAGSCTQDGESVYYIRDNGVGFDMRFYDKLFGVFQRLHSDAEYKGTGIGLALVKRIINRHGGRVWAEGKVDEGATFYFTLPTRQG
jgi:PAS domain S-box-containing protein